MSIILRVLYCVTNFVLFYVIVHQLLSLYPKAAKQKCRPSLIKNYGPLEWTSPRQTKQHATVITNAVRSCVPGIKISTSYIVNLLWN